MHFEWLASLQGTVVNQFGSNIKFDGQATTQLYAQTQLLRNLDQGVQQLSRSMWHPGAAYARTELSAAFVGVGF